MVRREDQKPLTVLRFPTTSCEFCSVEFHSDQEVAKHLVSSTHMRHKNSYDSINNVRLKEETARYKPNSFMEVLENINLRRPKDVLNLAQKSYFEVQNDEIAAVVDQLVNRLTQKYIEYIDPRLPQD